MAGDDEFSVVGPVKSVRENGVIKKGGSVGRRPNTT
jgi:hypothetical protein